MPMKYHRRYEPKTLRNTRTLQLKIYQRMVLESNFFRTNIKSKLSFICRLNLNLDADIYYGMLNTRRSQSHHSCRKIIGKGSISSYTEGITEILIKTFSQTSLKQNGDLKYHYRDLDTSPAALYQFVLQTRMFRYTRPTFSSRALIRLHSSCCLFPERRIVTRRSAKGVGGSRCRSLKCAPRRAIGPSPQPPQLLPRIKQRAAPSSCLALAYQRHGLGATSDNKTAWLTDDD